ncbi:RHS repeat-associated core domain-containing protein [Parapedobacter koreensis]|uniref:RHS repeat-associated core domain-containing protein n=1 Tax=Parapedobacter koreensis TaxID=332977 RepID=UPI00115FD01B|nr:RHS repeat-associated core domain-containing protein [Parapedobacter koreensis]
MSTYYVYNDFGQLAFVLTPGSSPDRGSLPAAGTARNAWLSDHVYQYKYDQRGRLVEKKVPGKGREFLVYNRLDQVVATQDSVQRGKSPQQWTAVKYDAHGRVVRKVQWRHQGSTANGDRRTAVQDSAYLITGANQWEERNAAGTAYTNRSWPRGNTAVLTEQFYDDYDVAGLPAAYKRTDYSAMTKGLPTVSRVQVLGTTQYLWSAVYYDDRGNAVREYRQHYKGGGTAGANNYDDVATEYSFTRQALASTRRHYASGSLSATVKTEHAYDHRERLADTWKSVDGGTRTLVSRNVYNELGQLYRRQLHSTNGTSFAETVTYGYNARGWLLKAVSPKFQQTLLYEDTTAVAMRQFNGNISRQGWRHGTGTVQGYAYTYDRLGRLLSGVSGSRNETAVYDAMGNIRSLSHDGAAMAYEYSPLGSNRLDRITGVGTAYAYDGNGNMTRDGRQNLSVAYNELNLPVSVGTSAAYTYDATGRKLRSEVSGTATDYIDGIEWEGGTLNLIRMEEGRMVKSGGNYVYDYMLRDHLGNTRSGFSSDATGVAKFVTDYYPFGRSHSGGATTSPKNRYLYNGKELQEVSGYYDYGARFYDPVIGRWGSVDPLAEKHFNLTPYNYVLNNPLIYIDPFGLDTLLYNQDTGKLLDRKLGEGKSAIYTVSGDYDEENIWGSASPLVYQVGQRSGGVSGKSFRNNHPLKGIGTQVGGQVYLEDLLDMTSEFNTLIADKMGLFESLNDYSSSWGYISPKFLVFKDWVTDNGPFDLKSLKRSNETSYAAIVIGEWSILNGELRRYDDYGNMSYGAWGRSAGFTTKDLIRGSNLNQIWKGMFGKTNMGGDETRDVNMILRGIREFR